MNNHISNQYHPHDFLRTATFDFIIHIQIIETFVIM